MSKSKLSQMSVKSESISVEIDEEESTKPEFIYGGPFIKQEKPDPFMNTATPINLQLQGTFKKSFAYYSLKERLPVILTKVIDQLSKKGGGEASTLIAYISKLKNELVTNKKYEHLQANTENAKKWNKWIDEADSKYYFTNTWLFTECYVYRRLRDGCEILPSLKDFDPFAEQKAKSFSDSLEVMCQVADKLTDMLPEGDKDKRKADFITLLKICLWSNKCDLSLSVGEAVSLGGIKESESIVDPFKLVLDFKDKLLVDDSGKIADQVCAKAEAMAKNIEGAVLKAKCSCDRLALAAGLPVVDKEETEKKEENPQEGDKKVNEVNKKENEGEQKDNEVIEKPEPPPCPAKLTTPTAVMFDIVCDNAGYELFTDLCLAHFLIAQNIVQKVRFHVKSIPWFVSDVTPNDFTNVINSCATADFTKNLPPDPAAEPEPAPEGEEPKEPEPKTLNAENLKNIGAQWQQYHNDGVFELLSDDFWTSPHIYRDMKKYDPFLYRKLQFAVAVMFKGDLNYRKLLGEKNWNPCTGFEAALQGFLPAPLIALRTVKADLICGLPKGKWEVLTKQDPQWMEKGDYGVIQFCAKSEALKISDRPCEDYGDKCRVVECPPKL